MRREVRSGRFGANKRQGQLRLAVAIASHTSSPLRDIESSDYAGHKLSIDEVWRIASLQSPCELANEARPLIQRSRQLVESLAAQPRAIYGINTGFGPLSGFRISSEELGPSDQSAPSFDGRTRPLFSAVETRAIMLARANMLARATRAFARN